MKLRELRNAALEYADRGWSVLPLRARHKAPDGALVPNGLHDATSDLVTVLRWWTGSPWANVGLNCEASGFVVVDVDPRNGGDDDLHELERELGPLPETVRAETGGGGEHYLFRHPGGTLVGQLWSPSKRARRAQGEKKVSSGVDLKDHGYIVAPPSIHPSGRGYAWDLSPEDIDLAELPEAWIEASRSRHAIRSADLAVDLDSDDPLRSIPAAVYVARLGKLEVVRDGWASCPFHSGGKERVPSLKCDGTIWACYGCEPLPGKRVMGGNVYDFAGMMAGYAIPLRGVDFLEIQARLSRYFLRRADA